MCREEHPQMKPTQDQAVEELRDEGFEPLLNGLSAPVTHNFDDGSAVRLIPTDDGGYVLGTKPRPETEHPPGYPPEEGNVTVYPASFAHEAASDVVEVLSEHFDEVPKDLVQRIHIEVDDMIEVTYYDEDEVEYQKAEPEP